MRKLIALAVMVAAIMSLAGIAGASGHDPWSATRTMQASPTGSGHDPW